MTSPRQADGRRLRETYAPPLVRQYPRTGTCHRKAIIICDNETLPAELFQLARRTRTPEAAASTLEEMEMQMIRKTLDKCSGNLSAVAAQLGITRQTLYNKMKKYGL